jgi:hypothetical protein
MSSRDFRTVTTVGGDKRPKAEGHQIQFLECSSDLKKNVLLFTLTTAESECVRFSTLPFIITYKCKRPNPLFNAARAESDANPRYHYLRATAPGSEVPEAEREADAILEPGEK